MDIFGFEHFKTNHFEQFCINYANEKLQGHFNEFNFSLEIQEYQKEDIQWSYEDFYFQTNTKCIEMIEAKRTGMLALLDEQCLMPNGNDETYCTKLKSEIQDNPYIYTAKMKGTQFTLKHYAAEVVYDAQGFCFKNKDPVQPSMLELLSTSHNEYIRQIFQDHLSKMEQNTKKGPKGQSSLFFESVTSKFKRQLTDLMMRINAAQPHFVRCINPNSQKEPGKLEPEMILDQLRCSGLMEAVRVSRAGFPVRVLHQDFTSRFSILVQPPPGDLRVAATHMCRSLRMPDEHYRVGKTKIFMRREIYDKLEEERSRLLVGQVKILQRVVRGHLARIVVKKIRLLRKASCVTIQRFIRMRLAKQVYLELLERRRRMQEAEARAKAQALPSPSSQDSNVQPHAENFHGSAMSDNSPSLPGRSPRSPTRVGYLSRSPQMDMQARIIEELEVQLTSVRELYYNERASQLALSNLVREVHMLKDPEEIVKRIKALEDKIQSQRQELASTAPIGQNRFEDEGLGRRTDSLTACLALLEDKLHLLLQVQQHNQGQQRMDFSRIRSEIEREYQAEVAMRFKAASDMQMRLEKCQEELRRRDEEILDLNGKLIQVRQTLSQRDTEITQLLNRADQQLMDRLRARDLEVENLEAIKNKMMTDRAVLESIIRNERKQREEEFNDMDANIRARDDRIKELSERLDEQLHRCEAIEKNLTAEMSRRLSSKDMEIQSKSSKVDELTSKLSMLQAQMSSNGASASGQGNEALQRGYVELKQQNHRLLQENAILESRLSNLARTVSVCRRSGGLRGDVVRQAGSELVRRGVDHERLDVMARMINDVAEAHDASVVRERTLKVLEHQLRDVRKHRAPCLLDSPCRSTSSTRE